MTNSLLVVDIEAFYDTKSKPKYSLKNNNLSTIEYVRDPRSCIMAVGIECLAGPSSVGYYDWCHDMPAAGLLENWLVGLRYEEATVIFHNGYFDAAMIYHHTGLLPRIIFCTMLAATYHYGAADKRAMFKNRKGGTNSLESLAQLVLGEGKRDGGDPLVKQDGKLDLWGTDNYEAYMDYMRQDVKLTSRLVGELIKGLPPLQRFMIDWAIRQFVVPKLHLNADKCYALAVEEETRIETACRDLGIDKSVFSSSAKFAALLEDNGVAVPMKESPSVKGKMIPALAQSDTGMAELKAEHKHNEYIMELIHARQAVASNQLLTRAKRYHDVATTGSAWPVHVIPSGAHTNRLTGSNGGGGSPLNLGKKSGLREAIEAPEGMRLLEFDYTGFELGLARWIANDLAGQAMILSGHDPYVTTYAKTAGIPVEQVDGSLRQAGKILVLSCQYGVGHKTMHASLTSNEKVLRPFTLNECSRLVDNFRNKLHPSVRDTWQLLDRYISWMEGTQVLANTPFSNEFSPSLRSKINLPQGTQWTSDGFVWPSGRHMSYKNLFYLNDDGKSIGMKDMFPGYYYRPRHDKSEPKKVYGGLMFENIAQSLAAEIMDTAQRRIEQELGYDVALQVYDSNAMVIPKPDTLEHLKDIARSVEAIATDLPWWENGPPLAVDFKYGQNYGQLQDLHLD